MMDMMQKRPILQLFTKGYVLIALMMASTFAAPSPDANSQSPTKEADKKPAASTSPSDKQPAPAAAPPSGAKPTAESAAPTPSEAKNLIVDTLPKGVKPSPAVDVDVATTKRIELANHGTQVINLKQAAGQVLLTDPKVADVQLVTPSTLYVYGRSPGTTEIIVTGQDMLTAYRYQIHVVSDYRELENLIRGFVPNCKITVHSVPDRALAARNCRLSKTC